MSAFAPFFQGCTALPAALCRPVCRLICAQVSAFAPSFQGCGGIDVGDLTRVEFDNYSGEVQDFCVDQVRPGCMGFGACGLGQGQIRNWRPLS